MSPTDHPLPVRTTDGPFRLPVIVDSSRPRRSELPVVDSPPAGALSLLLNHDSVLDATDLLGARSFALCDDKITFVFGTGHDRVTLHARIGDRLTVDDSGHWARVPGAGTATA